MSLGLGVLEEIGAEFHQFPTVRKKGVAVPSFLSSFPPHHPSSPLSPCLSFPSPLGFFHYYRCSQVSNIVSYCSPPLVFKTEFFPVDQVRLFSFLGGGWLDWGIGLGMWGSRVSWLGLDVGWACGVVGDAWAGCWLMLVEMEGVGVGGRCGYG